MAANRLNSTHKYFKRMNALPSAIFLHRRTIFAPAAARRREYRVCWKQVRKRQRYRQGSRFNRGLAFEKERDRDYLLPWVECSCNHLITPPHANLSRQSVQVPVCTPRLKRTRYH